MYSRCRRSNENFGITAIEALQTGTPSLLSTEVYVARDLAEKDAVQLCRPTIDDLRFWAWRRS
jgi:glycosyltransferase involved in cell wall biosynthesis